MNGGQKKKITPAVCEGILTLHDITYLRLSLIKAIPFYFLSILSFGLLYLIASWIPPLMCLLKYSVVNDIFAATHFYLENWDNVKVIVPKEPILTFDYEKGEAVYQVGFKNRGLSYIYVFQTHSFTAVELPVYRPFKEIRNQFLHANKSEDIHRLREIYGECAIDFEIPSRFVLFMKEILQPFFIFQLLSIIIWYMSEYYSFASVTLVVSIFSAGFNLFTIRSNLIRVHELVYFRSTVDVYRREKGMYVKMTGIPSTNIVPGDLLVIKEHYRMPCDCLLLTGQLLVDECALTGESVPLSKFPIPDNHDYYIANLHKAYTLYEGTYVIQRLGNQKLETIALVIRTNYSTIKGQLVRGILYPKANYLRVQRDSYIMILLLAVVCLLGFIIAFPPLLETLGVMDFILNVLSLVTCVIPATLPMILNISTTFSLLRNRQKQINCLSPARIIAAGRVDCVCFDKTGTLTQEDMDIRGYKISSNGVFKEFILPGFDKTAYANSEDKISVFRALSIMGTCHNVAISIEKGTRVMLGDPMEIKMIGFSGYLYVEGKKKKGVMYTMQNPLREVEYNIYRRFEFLSEMGRMSVIVQTEGKKEMRVYTKGAPEIVRTLCKPSTIPKNYDERLADYTTLGYRVLALAWRELTKEERRNKISNLPREKAESDLIFIGFLIFENMLKPDSRGVIATLNQAKIESKIVTGDNPITAVHVGREISMLNHDDVVYICDLVESNSEFYLQFRKLQGRDSMLLSKFKGDMSEMVGVLNRSQTKIVETLDSENVSGGQMINITQYMQQTRMSVVGVDGKIIRPSEEIIPLIPKGPHIQYAFTGKAFDFLYTHSMMHDTELSDWRIRTILLRAKVYSRMQPNHKSSLIEMIQENGRMVAMVGDGANDCGALQTADIGISLSQTEASISAPMTSNKGALTSVIDVLIEGRCILTTNIVIFKYLSFYGVLQYFTAVLLTLNDANLSNTQYLWQDLFIAAPIAAATAWTWPHYQLEDEMPPASLFTLRCMLSLAGSWTLQFIGQVFVYDLANSDVSNVNSSSLGLADQTIQGCALFTYAYLIFLGSGIAFSVSKPFRQPITTNFWLVGIMVIQLALLLALMFFEWARVNLFLMLDSTLYTPQFNREVVGLSAITTLILMLYETYFVNMFVRNIEKSIEEKKKAREAEKLYGLVEKKVNKSSIEMAEVNHKEK